MKKSEISVKNSIYSIAPIKTDTILSCKILVLLLHCFRIIKNFVGSNSKLKKHIASTLESVLKKVKSIQTIDLNDHTSIFKNISTDSSYTPERRTALSEAKVNQNFPAIAEHSLTVFDNMRNVDHKAVNENIQEQQIASNINSILNGKSNHKRGLHYRTSNTVIELFAINLNMYLEGDICQKDMEKFISENVK